MLRLGAWLIWLALYQYYLERICDFEKGKIRRIAVWGITGGTALAVWIAQLLIPNLKPAAGRWLTIAGWLLIMMVSFLYSPICFKSVFTKNSASSQIPLS